MRIFVCEVAKTIPLPASFSSSLFWCLLPGGLRLVKHAPIGVPCAQQREQRQRLSSAAGRLTGLCHTKLKPRFLIEYTAIDVM